MDKATIHEVMSEMGKKGMKELNKKLGKQGRIDRARNAAKSLWKKRKEKKWFDAICILRF